jgi:hypothetical protein
MRILEIARTAYLKGLFEGDVTRFDVSPYEDQSSPTAGGLAWLCREVVSDRYDLIVCEPNYRSPWNPLTLLRLVANRRAFNGRFSALRPFGAQTLRLARKTPVAVVDMEDWASIQRCDRFLLDACTLYFKRELPADPWKLFSHTLAPRLPSRRFRAAPANIRRLAKIRPLSLGIAPEMEPMLPIRPRQKKVDVFFIGNANGLPVRERGLAELRALQASGVVVDIPDRRLDRAEFYERCAGAHLVWSPEGFGWDCFRHYEAAACGSVPLINTPSIVRHRPLEHGQHCLTYAPEPGGLTAAIRAALTDRHALAQIAERARQHVVRHHRRAEIGRYIIEATLGEGAFAPVASDG